MTNLNIIWILAIGLGGACILGYIAQRLKLSPILGYLLAGYIIGPNFPGFIADIHLSDQLANIGVTLLMFAVGLNFNWNDLLAVKKIAVPGAIILSSISITVGILFSLYLGLSLAAGIVIGLAVCVSSTVVIVRGLTDQHMLQTVQGHTVLGWTIVEDLISVFGLILLPILAQPSTAAETSTVEFVYPLLIILVKIVALGLIMYSIGEKLIEKILINIARMRSHELFTLAILSCVFFIAVISSYVFGVSLALGAFIAGTVVGKTNVSHQAAANALPMRDAFAVVFFLSVGMLFNPMVVMKNLPLFFGLLAIILIIRPLFAFYIVKIAKYPLGIASSVAIAISQIGEYSFIIAEEGSYLKILPDNAYDIIVACAFISVFVNPFLFQLFRPYTIQKPRHSLEHLHIDKSYAGIYEEAFRPKAIVIGFGPVGQNVVSHFLHKKYLPLIIDQNIDTIEAIKEKKMRAIFGDATQFQILEKAGISNVQLLVITVPEFHVTEAIIRAAQQINPYIEIIARTHFKKDFQEAIRRGISGILCDEEVMAEKMIAVIDSKMKTGRI